MIKSSFALRRMVLSKHPATKRTRLPSRWVPKSVPFDSAPDVGTPYWTKQILAISVGATVLEVGMRLYHGSNVCVRSPRLYASDRRADFGPGFYLTSSKDQAIRWARLVTKRRNSGLAQVSVFSCDDAALSTLRLLQFEGATVEWLAFVGANRRGEKTDDYDVVRGPVANDATMPTLRLFFAGIYTEEEAIKRLLPQRLHDQYVFKTQAALNALNFSEVIMA
jgi:hypothetical protein